MRERQRSTIAAVRTVLREDHETGGHGLCQSEIASRLGFHGSTISRALRRMQLSGEVHSHRGHAPGRSYRVLLFQLTAAGRRRTSRRRPPGAAGLPPPSDLFVGRTHELGQLRRAFGRGGIVVIDGVPGVGKSTLLRRALRFTVASHATAWTNLSPSSTVLAAIEPLSRICSEGKDSGGREVLEHRPANVDASLLAAWVQRLLERPGRGVVWILDDIHAAPPATQDALREMLPLFAPGGPHVAVLISQRELPWPIPHGAVAHVSLRPLGRRDAISLTQALGLPEADFEPVYRETLGIPRYLRQSSLKGLAEGLPFAQAVLESLPPHQREALTPLAFSPSPLAPASGLLPGLTPDEIETLLSRAVLERTERGLALPEQLSRWIVEHTAWAEQRATHAFLAASGALPSGERFVHWVLADRPNEACRFLDAHRNEVSASPDPVLFSSILRLAHILPRGRRRGHVLLLAARVQLTWGDFVAASSYLERALEELPRTDPAALRAAADLSITTLRAGYAEQAEHWAKALAGLAPRGSWGSVVALARGNYLVYQGNLEAGGRFLETAARLARGRRDLEVRIMALHGLAQVAYEQKRHPDALALVEEAGGLAERARSGHFGRILRVFRSKTLAALGRGAEALEGYRAVAVEARAAGAKPQLVSALIGEAGLLWSSGDIARSLQISEEAIQVAEANQDRSLIAHAYAALANLQAKSGHPADARRLSERALRIARELGPSPSSSAAREAWERAHPRTPRRPKPATQGAAPPRPAALRRRPRAKD